MSTEQDRRLACALLLSLLVHAWLMSLIFGGQGWWLPIFRFPWLEQRIEAPELHVVVVAPQVATEEPAVTPVAPDTEPPPQASVERPAASEPARTPPVPRVTTPRRPAAAIVPEAKPKANDTPRTDVARVAPPAPTPLRAERLADTPPPPVQAPPVIAVERPDESTWVVPASPEISAPVVPAAPQASIPTTAPPSLPDADDAARARIEQAARERAAEDAAREDAAREEAARAEAARAERARLETERQAAALQEAALQEAALQEAARQQAIQAETAKVEAAKIEAENVEAAKAEAAKAEAARAEAARAEAEERREASLRAIGRQLDEEADRRDAATKAARESPSLPYSYGSPRRYRLFGRSDPNAEIISYAEAWGRKFEMNMTIDLVREAAKQPHTDPLVTVALRSDGSVESVTFVQSSGVPAIDDAIRRIVEGQKPYQAFPPALARDYDVIEIRRTWHFDVAIRLY